MLIFIPALPTPQSHSPHLWDTVITPNPSHEYHVNHTLDQVLANYSPLPAFYGPELKMCFTYLHG